MSVSYGDQGIFDLFFDWLLYRKRLRAAARTDRELRALSEEYMTHLENIIRCALELDAADIVPDDVVLTPEEAVFLRRNPPGRRRAAKEARPS